MIKRIFFDIILLGAVFHAPWWIVPPLAFVGAFLFPSYYEIIIAGILVDLLYGTAPPARGVWVLVVAFVLFVVALCLRRTVR